MAQNKIYNLLFLIILAQGILCKPIQNTAAELVIEQDTLDTTKESLSEESIYCRPIEESSEELEIEVVIEEIKVNGTDLEKFVLSNMGNYILIPQTYATKVVNATKRLIEDETLLNNKEIEVLEFKNKLSLFLDKHKPSASVKASHETMDCIFNITQPYLEQTEDKQTPASKFIKDLLNKYQFNVFPVNIEELEKAIDRQRVVGNNVEKLNLFTLDSLITIPQQYAVNATNATRYLLKDEAFEAMHQTEVLDFKKKLTVFLDKYDPSTINMKSIYKSMDAFANITDHYLELPEDKVTTETQFIIELLNKYNCKNFSMPFMKYLERFIKNFIVMYEERKDYLEKPYLGRFKQLTNLTAWQQQMESTDKFMHMF